MAVALSQYLIWQLIPPWGVVKYAVLHCGTVDEVRVR